MATDTAASAFARREVLRTLGEALWRHRRRTAAALALLVAAKLLMVLVPVALKAIVDDLGRPGALPAIPVFLLLGYALLRFAGGLFTELRDMVFARVAQSTVADFTVRVFEHLHALGARFHAARQTGALTRDVERGTQGIGFLMGTALFTLLPTVVEIVSVMAILTAGYSLWFAGIVALTFAAYAAYTYACTERRMAYQRRLNRLDSMAGGRLVDSLLNYETVAFYASEAYESRRLRRIMDTWVGVGVDNQRALSALHIGQSAIIAAGVGAVMLLAGREVAGGAMTVGDLVLVNAYIIQICLPLNTLGLIFRQSREALTNAERMCELLRHPRESDGAQALPPLELAGGEIRFEAVDFGYEPGRPVLSGIDLRIAPGTTTAVVGGSGSGKSTLARLLFRFYDPDAGRVAIDGQDLRAVSRASLRRSLGIVPQDTPLFNDTIAYNIAYGKPDASLPAIRTAARGARLDEFIESLPAKYETMVGERGVRLSGGERQRIAIARALLKNPPVMVFDEATSALDSRTERAIQGELARAAAGRTTLVIAHRLSTVVDADAIVVLEHGRIVERGRHAELLAAGGLYAQMWALQRQQTELEAAGVRLSLQPVNLGAVVAGVLDAARPAIDARGVRLYTQIGTDSARVTADPSALQQVVWDLCAHALAATPPGGRMELRLERSGADARLSVTDGRPGPEAASSDAGTLPPTLLAAPVDPLRVAGLLEPFGGRFESGPAPDGAGWTCAVALPLRAVAEAPPDSRDPQAAAGPDEAGLQGLSVAVVDDQAQARELVCGVLGDHGAQVRAYATGTAFLDTLAQAPATAWPGLLVCDISLGEPDGYAVVAEVRRLEAERGVPLARRMPAIALSGHAGAQDRLRAMLAGFQVHLAKPVAARELLATAAALAPGGARRAP